MEDEMDLEQLWTGPRNEKYLHECLGGAFGHYSCQMENQFHFLNVEDGESADQETIIDDFDIKDYIDPSMLGCFFPNGSLGHGRRGPPRKSTSVRVVESINHMDLQESSTSGGRKDSTRKNNEHWTQYEVQQLVNGVSEYGVGKWKAMKEKYFLTSIRTPVHLKDKWKNLVKACKKENGRMLLPLDQALLERIMEIDRSHPYPRQGNSAQEQGNSAQDRLAPPTSPDTSDPYPRQGNSDQDCLAPPTTPILDPALRWSVVKSRTKKV
ncbi:hypothetical protein PVAP13_9KG215400 [Panicum virgatum]|uniref:Uncharacterized protein n=1 Tax=Panicum virgatum TaxID=38727 RepID=A0A8T0NPS9_PANVG|nr:hypothetical protein PVAP13_9KG215400 [Panicum virgatum]